ncbi:hypothetical protein ACG92Y_12500 [Acinetobacter ursingii]|uniref:hypothetical protein n=1 Tax=Acinetobacter ursingii TaxID=108980 RepID=UPI003AF88A7F
MNAIKFIQQHGVDKARKIIENAPKWAMSINLNNGMYYQRCEHKTGDTFLFDFRKAIADYEQIFGGEHVVESNKCEILDHPEDYTSPNCKKYQEQVK